MRIYHRVWVLTALLGAWGSACMRRTPVLVDAQFPARLTLQHLALVKNTKLGQLQVIDQRRNRPLMRFSLAESFLTVARAVPHVSERMGSYWMDDEKQEECSALELTAATVDAVAIRVSGRVHCLKGYLPVEFTLEPQGDRVVMNVTSTSKDQGYNRIRLQFLAEENEHIFGGGEQFTHLDLRGRAIPIVSEEQGIGRGLQPITTGATLTAGAGGTDTSTYTPIPFFFTSAYRSFDTAQTAYQLWDFTRREFSLEIWDKQLTLSLATAANFETLIADYTARMGRMRRLPDWASGTILGVQGGKDKVEQILAAAVKAGNPVTAIWIQDWVGRRQTSFGSQLWWRWVPDEKSYPDFRNWVLSLKYRGIQVLGYINPFLADEGAMFEEAKAQNFLVKDAKGKPYKIQTAGFPAYLVDLSNPQARDFLKNIIKQNLLLNGLAGYMADFGEWLPWNAVMASGESATLWHNRYPVEWARLNREAIREVGLEGQVVFFTRAGFAGSAGESPLFWAGDQLVTYDEHDGLASAITGMLSGGISGIALNHSDIGGYTTINHFIRNYHRKRELLLRWAEFAVFTPFFRTHEGNRPDKNYQVYSDEKIVAEFAALGRTHLKLKPYFDELMAEAETTGLPLLRPVFLHYPFDRETFQLRHQAMLGRDLMIAPVIVEGATEGRIYLPKGTWTNSLTGKKWHGPGWTSFAAPVGTAVAFIRAGSPREQMLRQALTP
ncbi:MAG: alpha-glucosidase [Turneriella sp.]|nr:alpha-glucosidase [Turneriella sp.]